MPPSKTARAAVPVWWLASIAFHAVLLAWLLCFSPVKVIDLSQPTTNPAVSPARAQEIVAQLSEKQAEHLAASVRELQEMQQQLAELETRKREEFARASVAAAADAPIQTEAAQATAAKAQADALAVQARVDTVISNALQTRSETALKQLEALQQEAISAQARATDAQHQALEKLAISDQRFSDAYQAQAEANAAQERATRAQDAARALRTDAKSSKVQEAWAKVLSASNNVAQAEEDFADARNELVTLTNTLTAAQSTLSQLDTNSVPGLKKFSDARKKVDSIQQKITHRMGQMEKYTSRIQEQGERLRRAQTEAAGLAPAITNEQLIRQQAEAQRAQRDALQAQSRAREGLLAAQKLPAPAAGGSFAALPKNNDPGVRVEELDLPKLYDAALRTEAALTESYRRLRATELAMIRQVPLARAMELTDSVRVERPSLQDALTNSSDLQLARNAIQSARAEIGSMRQLAASLLAQAREMDRSGSRSAAGATVHSEGLPADISRSQSLEWLALEDENARAKDLTSAMRRSGGPVRSGSGGGGKSQSGSGAGGGSGSSGAMAGGAGNGFGGGGSGAGVGSAAGGGMGAAPAAVSGAIAASPGRIIRSRGEGTRWMFVDSWYLLGPFDNPGRVNLEKQFPPETIVDRSAVYDGKGGSRLRWEFHQAHEAKIVPPFRSYNAAGKRDLQYIIYYAATEIFCEEACDLWVAIGSDDFSKVWVNDQLIWASGKKTKSWRVDEGLRKVHFEKGVNRVLYRIENAHGQTEFSFVLGMP